MYKSQLQILLAEYVQPLTECIKTSGLSEQYGRTLFGNAEAIFALSTKLVDAFQSLSESEGRCMADILIEHVRFFVFVFVFVFFFFVFVLFFVFVF